MTAGETGQPSANPAERPTATTTATPTATATVTASAIAAVRATARSAAGRAGRQASAWLSAAAVAWRRSLQLRVATTTFLITGTVVVIIGVFLLDQVTAGVLRDKRDVAIKQVQLERDSASEVFSGVDVGQAASVAGAIQTILSSSGSAGLFTIAITSTSDGATTPSYPNVKIPDDLSRVVQLGYLAVEYAPIPGANGSGQTVPGLIVGEPVAARTGVFEIYYLFPLSSEQETIALLQRTVVIAGLVLVLLVVGIALLVTRQVVRPVRVAAETAARLAAGDLSQRITVRGTDDIARLGRSFNDMAGSLQRQIRRLEDLSRLQRRFTSDVSHELRTPLTTIRMASELLHSSREDFPPELSRSAELLTTELDRFESLLADLLEISRYDAGAAHLESETADLRGVVASTVSAHQMLAARHGAEVVVHEPSEPVTVDMDSRRVERILRNLVGNALDHSEGRPVVITVGYDDDAAAVTVRDHGVGLRPGEAGLVFNRFWRGDPSRSRLTGGTGLGLAISLEDARLHDGWLQAWGERGRGAQFRLTLPRQAGHTLMSSPLPLAPGDDDDDEPVRS